MSYAAVAAVAAAVIGAGVSYHNGQQQMKAQQSAADMAKRNAERQAKLAEEELNAANKKRPDTSGIMSAAQMAGKAGVSGTMLTGANGAGPLTLGKTNLLGGG
jgi:uncharacterized protein HemX